MFVALTACGGLGGSTNVDPTLRLADRTDIEITRLINAASGSEGFQAQAQVSQFDPFGRTDPCPTTVEDATARVVTLTGGCTTQDGTTIEGGVRLDNPLGWGELDYDPGHRSIYTFDQFALVNGNRQAYDGALEMTLGYSELDMDLTVDSFGGSVRSDVHMECSGGTRCDIGNSGLELGDAGGVLVSGSIGVSGQATHGSIRLQGLDTVVVTIANGCVGWTLDGTDRGVVCP